MRLALQEILLVLLSDRVSQTTDRQHKHLHRLDDLEGLIFQHLYNQPGRQSGFLIVCVVSGIAGGVFQFPIGITYTYGLA